MMNSKHLILTFAVEASTSNNAFGVFVFLVFHRFLKRKHICVYDKDPLINFPHSASMRNQTKAQNEREESESPLLTTFNIHDFALFYYF